MYPARRLRREMTKPELKLWLALRGRRCAGLKFRRQVPMGPFFLDFFEAAHKLAVEVDGRSHDDRGAYDRARQLELERRGLTVLRISNDEVLEDVERVVDGIVALTHRLAQGGGR
ncbi:endonuclease domain-containing protein [Paludisphaera soli]|uniref:endonuclease domain-containing protein n=1 Tax=Paludisphaera soli TaxID=2712865 RepID=UPI0036F2639D